MPVSSFYVCIYVAEGLFMLPDTLVTEVMGTNSYGDGPGVVLHPGLSQASSLPASLQLGQACLFPAPRLGIVVRVPSLIDP